MRQALEIPARQIAENGGADDGVVVERIRNGEDSFGWNAATDTWGDLIKAGVIDPTKVVRTALENAVSVAGTLLLAEATMVEVQDEPAASGSDQYSLE